MIPTTIPTTWRFPDVYTAWKNNNETLLSTPYCDRRLSRAARKVVQEHLLRTVFQDLEYNIMMERDNTNEQTIVHELLEQWLKSVPGFDVRESLCPLWSQQDIFKEDEAHTQYVYVQSLPVGISRNLKIAFPQYVLKHRQWKDTNNEKDYPTHWYQCGYCGKVFVSQFYLDVHMTMHHNTTGVEEVVCPATEWCKLVGMGNCHQQALQDEPYYDRGSSEWVKDMSSTMTRHKWSKIAHSIPCSTEQLRKDCRSVLARCGFPNMNDDDVNDNLLSNGKDDNVDDDFVPASQHDDLASLFCQSLTCPSQQNLWHYFEDEAHEFLTGLASSTSIPSALSFQAYWENVWKEESNHHYSVFTWIGGATILLLFLWLLRRMTKNSHPVTPNSRGSIPAGKRLLYNKNGSLRRQEHRNSVFRQRMRQKQD